MTHNLCKKNAMDKVLLSSIFSFGLQQFLDYDGEYHQDSRFTNSIFEIFNFLNFFLMNSIELPNKMFKSKTFCQIRKGNLCPPIQLNRTYLIKYLTASSDR